MGYGEKRRFGHALPTLGSGLLLALLSAANGAEPQLPGDDDTTVADAARPAPGHHVTGFRIRPSLAVTGRYDSNVFSTERDPRSDWVTLLSPRLKIDSTWARHGLQFDTGAEIGHFQRFVREDYVDHWADARGRIDLGEESQVHLGIGVRSDHEERDAPDAHGGGFEPTLFDSHHADLGLTGRVGDTGYRMGLTYEALDYHNAAAPGGEIFNDDRDRTLLGLGLRAEQPLQDDWALFVQLLVERRDYDRPSDQHGFRRSSEGYRAAAGLKTGLPGDGEAEAYLGIIGQDYDDTDFSTLRALDFGSRLKLALATDTRLTVELSRSLEETTVVDSPGYLRTRLSLAAERGTSARLSSFLKLEYGVSDYRQIERENSDYSVSAGVKYFLSPNVFLTAGASHSQRDSDAPDTTTGGGDFERQVFFLTLTGQFYPL